MWTCTITAASGEERALSSLAVVEAVLVETAAVVGVVVVGSPAPIAKREVCTWGSDSWTPIGCSEDVVEVGNTEFAVDKFFCMAWSKIACSVHCASFSVLNR